MTSSKRYDKNIDYEFFRQVNVTVIEHAPWQFGLTHPDLVGKFVWYPERGSLIYEQPQWGVCKVGEYTNTEDVWDQIKKKLN